MYIFVFWHFFYHIFALAFYHFWQSYQGGRNALFYLKKCAPRYFASCLLSFLRYIMVLFDICDVFLDAPLVGNKTEAAFKQNFSQNVSRLHPSWADHPYSHFEIILKFIPISRSPVLDLLSTSELKKYR